MNNINKIFIAIIIIVNIFRHSLATEIEKYVQVGVPIDDLSLELTLIDISYSNYPAVSLPIFKGTPSSISAGASKMMMFLWEKNQHYMSIYTLGKGEAELIDNAKKQTKFPPYTIPILSFEDDSYDLLASFDKDEPIFYILNEELSYIALVGTDKRNSSSYIEEIFFTGIIEEKVLAVTYSYEADKILWVVNNLPN
ncbi:hypothetical protein [Alteromonas sp. M12]|uniref:hypothetical protein n=1 Tax=Alteromonas sp. M12 TaxID=3135644 RepID=UPI00319E6CF2